MAASFESTALHELSAQALGAAYGRGELSPIEVTRAVLDRIERWEPHVKATYALDAEAALAMAGASEARWRAAQPLSLLDGIPVTIKENIATRGVPMPLGCAATELVPAADDAPPAARLREAGAVLLGKTTMPDWGMLTSSLSSFHELTRNPWDLALTPGGSSSGAGAAAAAGYGPVHLGTDIGGSLRLPASFNGVFTLKPSLGRVPINPPYYGRVAGPITRTVGDAALAMLSLSKPDARDTMSLPYQPLDWFALDAEPERKLKGLRIGLQLDAGWGLPVNAEVSAAIQAAARLFESAGAFIEPLEPFTTRAMIEGLDRFWRLRSWRDFAALPADAQALVLPYIRDWAAGSKGSSGLEMFEGFSQIAAIREATVAATLKFDHVLSPVSPVVAFAADKASPLDDPAQPFEHIAFTLPYNMSEQPAASINAGYSEAGLPIGLQLSGRRFDDLGVLQAARAYEQLREAQRPWPEPPAPASSS